MTTISPTDFDALRNVVKELSGISLDDDKSYLIETRLMPVIRKHGFASIADLAKQVPDNDDLRKEVVEAMTTNETLFFRDHKPFEVLKNEIFPALGESEQSAIRIWTAACSFGQEPYSVAMQLLENEEILGGKPVEIIATDIDSQVLQKAQEAVYSQFEVQRGLPVTLLMKYFVQKGEHWHLNDEVKSKVSFQQANLLEPQDDLGEFDIIFCRNVLIYFEQETKQIVLNNLTKNLLPGGYLVIGSSETLQGLDVSVEMFKNSHGIYKKT